MFQRGPSDQDKQHEVEAATRTSREQQRRRCKASKTIEFSDTVNNTINPVVVARSANETSQGMGQSLPSSCNPCRWHNFHRPDY